MNSGDAEALIRHAETFGITTEAAVSRRWGARGAALLAELVASKRLEQGGHLSDGTTFYRIYQNARGKRGLPPQQRYLFLAFCVLRQVERRPIASHRIAERYPDFTSRALHCVENGTPPRIWRVYTPTSERADIQTARHIRQEYLKTQQHLPPDSTFRKLVAGGNYGFAVLLDDQARAHNLRQLLAERPLPPEIAATVECFA